MNTKMLAGFACVFLCATVSAQLITGPLEPCLVEIDERRIVTVAVVDEGESTEHAITYYSDVGGRNPRTAEDGFGAPFPSALESAVSLAAGDGDHRWPLETHCEFTYAVPHPVHVYVYKIDPMRDFKMHPSWFDDVPMEKNGLAVLADEMAAHQEKTGKK